MNLRPKSFFELCCGIAALAMAGMILAGIACTLHREFYR